MDYPYFNQAGYPGNDSKGVMATCVTGKEADCQDPKGKYAYDWGYETKCPQSDTDCMGHGLKITVDGHVWGMSDPWGYSLRNCTSYIAWRLASLGVKPAEFENLHNGGDWYKNSPASRRSKTPAIGDAAVQPPAKSHPDGHVAFVEAVHSNRTITVSEYNYHENGTGDERTGTPSALGLTEFVDFGVKSLGWTAANVPLPANAATEDLPEIAATACPSASQCVAVGDYYTNSVDYRALLVTESDSSWKATAAPLPSGADPAYDSSLLSVSCAPDSACVAVGFYRDSSGSEHGLLLSGSGTSWTATEAPLPANAASGNGTAATLSSVACPSATDCVAVGGYSTSSDFPGMVLSGSGTSWTATEAPDPADVGNNELDVDSLSSVACSSATQCVAAGTYVNSADNVQLLMLSGAGTAWTATGVLPPANAYTSFADNEKYVSVSSVTCTTAQCVVVGSYTANGSVAQGLGLLMTGYGTSWTATHAPLAHGMSDGSLFSVACSSPVTCVAVGQGGEGDKANGILAYGSGSSWATIQAPLPPNAGSFENGYLASIACPAASTCIASGIYTSSSAVGGLLVSGTGKTWSPAETPFPSGATEDIAGPIACPSVTLCVSVGVDYGSFNSGVLVLSGPA